MPYSQIPAGTSRTAAALGLCRWHDEVPIWKDEKLLAEPGIDCGHAHHDAGFFQNGTPPSPMAPPAEAIRDEFMHTLDLRRR